MKKIIGVITAGIMLMITATPAYAFLETTNQPLVLKTTSVFAPGEIIVKFNNKVDTMTIAGICTQYGLSVLSSNPTAGFQQLKVPQGISVMKLVTILQKNPNIAYAEPNYIAAADMSPNDPYYSYQWHMHDLTQGGINMEPAWDISTGAGTIVAIVDTGVRIGSDLAGTSFVAGYDFVNNDNDPVDDNGHGTHVAGTIAQSTNNNEGVTGVAFSASIMPVKVLNNLGSGTYTQIANGIYYAVDNGAKIISMSLGGSSSSQTLQDACAYAYNHGVTCVAAAGNNGMNQILYPAAYNAYVIAVGATQYDKTRAPYSNYGSSLDVVAPGGNTNVDQNGDGYGDGVLQQTFTISGSTITWGYFFYQGTSMATPHVSGAAALLYSQGVTTPDNIRNVLQTTATDLGATGFDIYYGYGLINAYNALQYTPGNTPPTCSLTANPTQGVAPLTTIFTMTASDTDGTIESWTLDTNNDGTAEYSGSGSPPATQTHTYTTPGTYTAKLTVWDDDNANGFDTETITVTQENSAPDTPQKPSGPTTGLKNRLYKYSTRTTDPNGDKVYYLWDWGDGTTSGWFGPYISGKKVTQSHKWQTPGNYFVRVKAKDSYGAESAWSEALSVTIQ